MSKKEVVLKKALNLQAPNDVMKFASVLKGYIKQNKLSTNIHGKYYVFSDGWKFAGVSFGLTHIPSEPVNLSEGNEIKYSCAVDIINITSGVKIGAGFALCSNKESSKAKFDEYAILSMAQTRAIAKAYRNLLGFLMNSAGYEATPAEEMDEVKKPAVTNHVDILDPKGVKEVITAIKEVKTVPELETFWKTLATEERANDEILSAVKKHKIKIAA